jgi:hypothetical protein
LTVCCTDSSWLLLPLLLLLLLQPEDLLIPLVRDRDEMGLPLPRQAFSGKLMLLVFWLGPEGLPYATVSPNPP